ncbi:DJ-1/PfpI family protein [Nonomuraea dietziae]|uniref:DJ-1/PfpI family protein n=1 Tax=Nonomuraea dietziae TaxID=65515 RepID=UPI0031DB84D5
MTGWVAAAARGARRVASVCSGAFLLAEAASAGRPPRHTTHWARAERLAQDYPPSPCSRTPSSIRDGHVWSSAGVTAGMDLALALVEEDQGRRWRWRSPVTWCCSCARPGNQSQFSVACGRCSLPPTPSGTP